MASRRRPCPLGILSSIGYAIAGLRWPAELKYLTILILTVAATVRTDDLLVKRPRLTRFVLGLKPKRIK
jgi:hypothetical protein